MSSKTDLKNEPIITRSKCTERNGVKRGKTRVGESPLDGIVFISDWLRKKQNQHVQIDLVESSRTDQLNVIQSLVKDYLKLSQR